MQQKSIALYETYNIHTYAAIIFVEGIVKRGISLHLNNKITLSNLIMQKILVEITMGLTVIRLMRVLNSNLT